MADAIRVEGLRELQRELRRLERRDLQREVRQVNRSAASVVGEEAERRAPRSTGRLANSIGVQGQRDRAVVKAGSAKRVPYGGPIHFGWAARNITAQPFIWAAMRAKSDEVDRTYDELIRAVIARAIES